MFDVSSWWRFSGVAVRMIVKRPPLSASCGALAGAPPLVVRGQVTGTAAQGPAGDEVVRALRSDQPYHAVTPGTFERLGWALPDGGATVKALADAAPGGAFDPRALEAASPDSLGYTAKWH